jgi:superfamily II DNA or RNA helicase
MGVFTRLLKAKVKQVEALSTSIKEFEGLSGPSLVIQNSFVYVVNFPSEITEAIHRELTYKDDSVSMDIKRTYKTIDYFMSKNKTRMAYMLKGKIKELKEKEITHWFKDGRFPTGHLTLILNLLKGLRFNDFECIDERIKPEANVILRLINNFDEPRYYQSEAVEACVQKGQGVIEACVGSGKSLLALMLIRRLSVKTLIVVPSGGLLEQWEEVAATHFGSKVKAYDAKAIRKVKTLAPIRLITIQSLNSLRKTNEAQLILEDLDCVIYDEFHHSTANSYTNLMEETNHIFYRYGMTGSFLVNTGSELALKGMLHERIYHYPATKAVEDGYITPSTYIITTLEGKPHPDYQKQYELNYCIKKTKKGIEGAKPLINDILNKIKTVIPKNEQIFIIVDRKDDSGRIIKEFLNANGVDAVFISGDDKKEVRSKIIDAYNRKQIRILIGSAVVGEGIDIRSSQHLLLINGGKSPIKLIQNIGRVVRLDEGKKMSYIYDYLFEGANFCERHLKQRIANYEFHFGGEIIWL